MAIVLDGKSLTLDKLVAVARRGEPVELAPESLDKIKACRAVIEEKIKAHEIMYGVNTGIGEFSEIVLDDEQVKQFQRYLIYNHAAGIGEPAPIEHIRAAMAELRRRLSPEGNVVSEAGRRRTVEVFGEPLSPAQVVAAASAKHVVGADLHQGAIEPAASLDEVSQALHVDPPRLV